MTNCGCCATIIIAGFLVNLTNFIGNRTFPRLDYERIKIKTDIPADNATYYGYYPYRASVGIKDKPQKIDIRIVIKEFRKQAEFRVKLSQDDSIISPVYIHPLSFPAEQQFIANSNQKFQEDYPRVRYDI